MTAIVRDLGMRLEQGLNLKTLKAALTELFFLEDIQV